MYIDLCTSLYSIYSISMYVYVHNQAVYYSYNSMDMYIYSVRIKYI